MSDFLKMIDVQNVILLYRWFCFIVKSFFNILNKDFVYFLAKTMKGIKKKFENIKESTFKQKLVRVYNSGKNFKHLILYYYV